MPTITHRSIVSASGYTEAAIKKANCHGVELFTIEKWSGDLATDFPGCGMSGAPDECIRFGGKMLLCWAQHAFHLIVTEQKEPFNVDATTILHEKSGKNHPQYKSFGNYYKDILLRSTEFLFPLQPAAAVRSIFPLRRVGESSFVAASPAWPHSHTVDLREDGVYIKRSDGFVQITAITIHGQLQWQRNDEPAAYHVLKRVGNGTPYAGAMVIEGQRDGEMVCFVVAPDSPTAGVHSVKLEQKHLRAIRKLKLINDQQQIV